MVAVAGEERTYPRHPRDRASGDARRRRILDEAAGELASHGWSAASVSRIAEGAGLRTSGLLHHFPNKAALLLAALEQIDATANARFARAAGPDPRGRAAVDGLVANVAALLEHPDEARASLVVAAEAVTDDHPAATWVQERHRAFVGWFAERLREAVADGELRADLDPEVEAARLIANAHGALLMWLADPDLIDPAASLRSQVESLRAHS